VRHTRPGHGEGAPRIGVYRSVPILVGDDFDGHSSGIVICTVEDVVIFEKFGSDGWNECVDF
jgi:hypothetical protein